MALPPLISWNVQLLRVSSFVLFNDRGKEQKWWHDTFGTDPETVTAKPKENLVQFEGGFEGGALKLLVQPGRVDWLWSLSLETIDFSSGKIPSLGSPEEAWGKLLKAITPWLKQSPPAVRYAVGLIVDQQVSDKSAAYGLLQAYLPAVRLSASNSSDFTYQINRPKESRVIPGLHLNRLSKWAAVSAQFVEFMQSGQSTRKELSVVRLELDVNSNLVAGVPLPKEKGLDLINELASELFVIGAKGDVEK